MKEIHAYRNEDGTYSICAVYDDTYCGDELRHVIGWIPRAKIDIDVLADQSSGEICSLIVEEDNKDELS